MTKLDRFLKIIWAINGVVFLIFAWFSIYPHLLRMWRPRPKPSRSGLIVGEKLEEARQEGLRLQAIKIDSPVLIEQTKYFVFPLSKKDLEKPALAELSLPPARHPIYSRHRGLLNNLLFYKTDGSDVHLLFDKKVLIPFYSIPRSDIGKFIYYLVIEEDTNTDGRLDQYDDAKYLYLSDLTGRNLRHLDYPKGRINNVQPENETGDLLIFMTEDTNQDGQWTETDFDILKRLDVQTGEIKDIVDEEFIRKVQKIAFQ